MNPIYSGYELDKVTSQVLRQEENSPNKPSPISTSTQQTKSIVITLPSPRALRHEVLLTPKEAQSKKLKKGYAYELVDNNQPLPESLVEGTNKRERKVSTLHPDFVPVSIKIFFLIISERLVVQ